MEDLEGRVAVVTGGGSGIGSGICRALAGAGAQLIVADVDREKAAGVAASLREQGARARAEFVDVADLDSVARLATPPWPSTARWTCCATTPACTWAAARAT